MNLENIERRCISARTRAYTSGKVWIGAARWSRARFGAPLAGNSLAPVSLVLARLGESRPRLRWARIGASAILLALFTGKSAMGKYVS